jgi:hypothetical protein
MATKARLHWFWRGAIALLMGVVMCVVSYLGVGALLQSHRLSHETGLVVIVLLAILPGIVVYGLLTRCFGPPARDGETHCRKCDHVLRGISEPRCSECGEAI